VAARRAARADVPLPLLAVPQEPWHPVCDVRGRAGERLSPSRAGARRSLGVVSRILPLLLPQLRIRGAFGRRLRRTSLRAGGEFHGGSRRSADRSHLRRVEGAMARDPRRPRSFRCVSRRLRRSGHLRSAAARSARRAARQLSLRCRHVRRGRQAAPRRELPLRPVPEGSLRRSRGEPLHRRRRREVHPRRRQPLFLQAPRSAVLHAGLLSHVRLRHAAHRSRAGDRDRTDGKPRRRSRNSPAVPHLRRLEGALVRDRRRAPAIRRGIAEPLTGSTARFASCVGRERPLTRR
jgi:hypothetical protein